MSSEKPPLCPHAQCDMAGMRKEITSISGDLRQIKTAIMGSLDEKTTGLIGRVRALEWWQRSLVWALGFILALASLALASLKR